MKRFLLLPVIAAVSLAACKKDKDADQQGVAIVLSKRSDGGIQESAVAKGGSDVLSPHKNVQNTKIFYKGETRPQAEYLTITIPGQTEIYSGIYIRYENGPVPDTTYQGYVNRLQGKGFVIQKKTMTGLERFTY